MRTTNKIAMLGNLLIGSVAGVLAWNSNVLQSGILPGRNSIRPTGPERASLRQARLHGATPNVAASRNETILRKMTTERVTVRDRATGELHAVERTVPGPFVYPQTKKLVARTLAMSVTKFGTA